MFDGLYSNFSKKPQRHSQWLNEEETLGSIVKNSTDCPKLNVIYSALVNDLKAVLEVKTAVDAIEIIHEIESNLNKLYHRFEDDGLPRFDDFHKDLSQIFLQKYWEMKRNPISASSEDQWLLQAILIAIEEEIYIWQEKTQEV
jgi:hypothetical protein